MCWAVAVGLTRVYLGMHWAADLLGGRHFALTRLTAAMALCAATGQAKTARAAADNYGLAPAPTHPPCRSGDNHVSARRQPH